MLLADYDLFKQGQLLHLQEHLRQELEATSQSESQSDKKSRIWLNKGELALLFGDPDTAEDCFKEAIKNSKNPCIYAECLNKLGEVYLLVGQWTEAKFSFKKAKHVYFEQRNAEFKKDFLGCVYRNIGILHKELGNFEKAKFHLEEAKRVDEAQLGADHYYYAQDLAELAMVLDKQGDRDEAADFIKQALSIERTYFNTEDQNQFQGSSSDTSWPQHPCYAKDIIRQCRIKRTYLDPDLPKSELQLKLLEDLDRAEQIILNAASSRPNNQPDQPFFDLDITFLHILNGNLGHDKQKQERAIDNAKEDINRWQEKSKFFRTKEGQPPPKQHWLRGYSLAEYTDLRIKDSNKTGAIQNYKEAIQNYNGAIEIITTWYEDDSHDRLIKPFLHLAEISKELGDYPNALVNYERSLSISIAKRGKMHKFVGNNYRGIGQVYYELGKFNEAEEAVRKAIDIHEPLMSNPKYGPSEYCEDLVLLGRIKLKNRSGPEEVLQTIKPGEDRLSLASEEKKLKQIHAKLLIIKAQAVYLQSSRESDGQTKTNLLKAAINHCKESLNRNGTAEAYYKLGKIYSKQKFSNDEIRKQFTQASKFDQGKYSIRAELELSLLSSQEPESRIPSTTHYEYAVLSGDVYKKGAPSSSDQWTLFKTSHDFYLSEKGFFGAAYMHKTRKEIIFAFKGTEPTDLGDIKADIDLFQNHIHQQWGYAREFTEKTMEQAKAKDCYRSYTGHSLGGAIAEIRAWEDVQERKVYCTAVTFETPGTKELIEAIERKPFNPNPRLDVVTYVAAPDYINTAKEHIGKLIQVFISPSKKLRFLFFKQLRSTGEQHRINAIITAFNLTTGIPNNHRNPLEVIRWPVGKFQYDEVFRFTEECKDFQSTNEMPLHKLEMLEKRAGYHTEEDQEFLYRLSRSDFPPEVWQFIINNIQTLDQKDEYGIDHRIWAGCRVVGDKLFIQQIQLTAFQFRNLVCQQYDRFNRSNAPAPSTQRRESLEVAEEESLTPGASSSGAGVGAPALT